jgi:hypothetical protein
MNGYMTAKELAKRWGCHVGSLANQRWEDRGPRYERIGRAVVYHISAVEAYEKAHPELLQKLKPKSRPT